ncbi:MAG: alpha-glycosidase [Lachnospiraceae bacterium]|nr:alpha-glycosidase [Lachnospiraceae bacterium]
MNFFSESIYSDGTRGFVSDPLPSVGEEIRIRVRMLASGAEAVTGAFNPAGGAGENAAPEPAGVFLLQMVNGAEHLTEMTCEEVRDGLAYYGCSVKVNEPKLSYHFVVACADVIYYYTQAGVTTYVPGNEDNFLLLTKYRQPEWIRGAVFYQIFPWAYGGLDGIREAIPYLKELGVTALYLNPIFRAPSYHKYDCSDYFHVDEQFGGDEALARLSAALHENGMKLILDISINHTGLEHAWTQGKRHFYFEGADGKLQGWAGYEGLPVLDYRNEELRDLIYRGPDSVLRKWLKPPYSIDGWRFDVADVFARNDEVQLADEVWREVCDAIREVNPEAVIIGEHWGDCSAYLQGDLWNMPMNYYGFGRIVRQFAGLPELFTARNAVLAGIPYKMTAQDVAARTVSHYRHLPQVIADCQMNLFDSHDVPRVHNHASITKNQMRSIVLSQLLWTGIPCIYYGDELGIDGYVEHDKGFRYPMPWDNRPEDADWYYALYAQMIRLRKEVPAFAEGGRKVLYAEGYVLAVARFFAEELYIGVISMEEEETCVRIPAFLAGTKREPGESGADALAKAFGSGNLQVEEAFGTPVSAHLDGEGWLEVTLPAQGSVLLNIPEIKEG